MSQLLIDFTVRKDPVQEALDAWLMRHADEIHSWEGEITQEGWEAGDLSGFLPAYHHGVYVIGEVVPECQYPCDGCAAVPTGIRSCTPRVKIGIAKDMYMRFANLKTGSSRELEVLALMPFKEPRLAEKQLHDIFAPHRIRVGRRTEWFWDSAAMRDLVAEVVSFGAEWAGAT